MSKTDDKIGIKNISFCQGLCVKWVYWLMVGYGVSELPISIKNDF